MPTPPITIPIAAPIAPLSTPEITLPCGKKIPSIPLIPNLSFTITIPPFNLFPAKKPKKGSKPSRKLTKLKDRIERLKKLCNSNIRPPRS
jgi:hypothetical protein